MSTGDPLSGDPLSGDPLSGDPNPTPEVSPARIGWRSRVLSTVLVVVVGVFLVVAVVNNWTAVRQDLAALSWHDLVASGVAGALAVTCSALGWRVVLAGLGQRVPLHPALTMFFAGQLGKYVPGSVWTAAIQAELGRRRNIPRSTMLVSYLISLMIAVATGGLVGMLVLLGPDAARGTALWMLLAAGIVGVALIWPGWLNRALVWAFTRAGRTPPPTELPGRSLAGAVAWLIACWAFFGVHVWLLARPLGAEATDLVPTTGAFALAFVAGLLVVPLPAGAGVREGVLVATMAGFIGAPAALTVSLVSRLVLLGVDLFLAALFGVGRVARSVRRRGVGSTQR